MMMEKVRRVRFIQEKRHLSQNVSVVRCNKKLPLCIGDESDNNVLTIVKPYSEIRNMPKGVVKIIITICFKAKKTFRGKKKPRLQ